MPIDDLVNKYLLTQADVDGHTCHPFVQTYENSFVTPLIDGYAYFERLFDAINALTGPADQQGIYMASWAFHRDFQFRSPTGTLLTSLVDLLEIKADEGADVRVLCWVSDYVMSTGFAPAKAPLDLAQAVSGGARDATKVATQTDNLLTIHRLRSRPSLAARVIANTLNDPLGAVHTKFALVFDASSAFGFTGGMDPFDQPPNDRFSKPLHSLKGWHSDGAAHTWHDVMAQVEGDAMQAFFDFFRSMWNTLAAPVTTPGASSHYRFTDPETNQPITLQGVPTASTLISQRNLPSNPAVAGSLMRVQSLRTIPKPSFQPFWGGALATSLPGNIPPLPANPPFQRPILPGAEDGIFETEHALRKAIRAAETYIYVEDQKMEGSVMFGYLREALQDPARPDLKVILITGITDPADPPPSDRDQVLREFLTDGLQQSELDRLVLFEHAIAVIHSKLWLIDDKFAYIGSANIFNRGMFIEIEHGVSFVHDGATNVVDQLRRDLWGEHFRLAPTAAERVDLLSLAHSLAIWNPAWGPGLTPSLTLPAYTDDAQKFRRSWITELSDAKAFFKKLNSRSPALSPLALPVRNAFGSVETVTLGGHEYVKWRDANRDPALVPVRPNAPSRNPVPPTPPPITAAGDDFIDDPTLPANDVGSGKPGLAGEWIVLAESSTATDLHFRKITLHAGTRIFFNALPFTASAATLDYALLTPVLKRVPLPKPVTGIPMLPPWYFLVPDPKADC